MGKRKEEDGTVVIDEQLPADEAGDGSADDAEERALFKKMIEDDPDLQDSDLPEPKLKATDGSDIEEDDEDDEDEPAPAPASEKPRAADDEDGDEAAPAGGQQQTSKEPPAVKGESGEDSPGKAEGKKESQTTPEWFRSIPEEHREAANEFLSAQGRHIARLEQRIKGHLGQLRPTQQALTQLTRERNQLAGILEKVQSGEIGSAGDRLKDVLAWVDREYEDYPDERDKLKRRLTDSFGGQASVEIPRELLPQGGQFQREVSPFDRRQERVALEEAYPNWGEIRFSPEFDEWVSQQPRQVQSRLGSPLASENIQLLDDFMAANPDWNPPAQAGDFHSVFQAQYNPLFRGWAEAEGLDPNTNWGQMPEYRRDIILNKFKQDLDTVQREFADPSNPGTQDPGDGGAGDDRGQRLKRRRQQQLSDRDPASRRAGVKPGQPIDLNTEEGQRAYFNQLIEADPDLRSQH